MNTYKNVLLTTLAILVALAIAELFIDLPVIRGSVTVPLLALSGMMIAFWFLPNGLLFWLFHIVFLIMFVPLFLNLFFDSTAIINIPIAARLAEYMPILIPATVALSIALNRKGR